MPPGSAAHRARAPKLATPLPDGHAGQAPGPPALPPREADIGQYDAQNHPSASRTSAGKPQAGWANVTATWGLEANRRTSSPALWLVNARDAWGPWPNSVQAPQKPLRTVDYWSLHTESVPRASVATQPRFGVTLGSVMRRVGGDASRDRGRHPTEASQGVANPRRAAGATVVCYRLRLCRCTEVKKTSCRPQKSATNS
jgi:hypothetical protein